MKRLLAGLAVLVATTALAGCYDPGYRYVRGNGYGGEAYYGTGATVVYDNGYYAGPGWYGPGWGYYGCCYAPGVVVGGVWYRNGYRYRGHGWHGPPPRGGWHGGHWGGRPGVRPGGRPAGGWHGGGRGGHGHGGH
jgi:hypothetical protein